MSTSASVSDCITDNHQTIMCSGDQRSDAVRTEPIVWDKGARALWRLKGGNDRTSIALQGLL